MEVVIRLDDGLHPFGAKPLPKPVLSKWELNPQEQNSMKFNQILSYRYMPQWYDWLSNIEWSTVSKALKKSRKI